MKDLKDTLRALITEHKRVLIQKVLAQRSRYVSFVFEHFYHEHNIHAAMRSIESCGFQDVYSIANEKVRNGLTVTKGADYWLTLYQYPYETLGAQPCFDKLQDEGYLLVGTTPHESAYSIEHVPLDKKIALVFGNERLGLSEYAQSRLDATVTIPMYGFTESFNVSVSVALAAYELRKRLEASSLEWHITQEEKDALELEWLKRLVRGSEHIEKQYLE